MKRSFPLTRANVVAAIDSDAALAIARKLPPGAVDVLELRVDAFADRPHKLLDAAQQLRFPLLITVRHPLEGGANALSLTQRRELFAQFLPHAAAVDIELRSVERLKHLVSEIRARGVKLVLSSHHFQSTPSTVRLHEVARRALLEKADICKLAARTDRIADVAALLAFFAQQRRIPLSVMGMGRFGRASRLILAQAGSVLNYGYLDRPVAGGQWPARELRKRINELLA